MTQLTIQQAFEQARQLQARGDVTQAEQLYRQIVAVQPNHLDATLLLALTLAQQEKVDDSEKFIAAAKRLAPQSPVVLANIAIIRANQKRWAEALDAIDAAIALQPKSRELLNTKGNVLQESGQIEKAVGVYREVVGLDPSFAPSWNNLGAAESMAGRTTDAIASFQRAAALDPKDPGTQFNLARALGEIGDHERALSSVDRALQIAPMYADALNQRGVILQSLGRMDAAIESYNLAIAAQPSLAVAHNNLGVAYQAKREYDKAISAYRQAITIRPNYSDVYGNLAQALSQIGELDAALEIYRRSRDLAADRRSASGMMLFLHTHPHFDAKKILREHRLWEETYAKPLYQVSVQHVNDPDPDRQLRIGYLSADLNEHPEGRFMLPLMEHHDHRNFHITCYYNNAQSDSMTARLKPLADDWQNVYRLTDEKLAQQIRADRIDVLVDLTMHAKASRLLVFARKPAPVSMSYLAYCSTTGLSAIDYRISDPYLDPPGIDESVYAEKTARLSASYWVYSVPEAAPDVLPPPSEATSCITFGCMNNFWKVSRATIEMWHDLLSQLPDARLLVHSHDGSHRKTFVDRLGISSSRVSFVGFQPAKEYFQTYSQIDVSLDPFPYGGGTTSCDSLWMGVPVITRAGNTAVSRAGSSVLSNVGLPEFVTHSRDEYVRAAIALSKDASRLLQLRFELRDRMRQSPLMDGARLARDLENIYRSAWHDWCPKQNK